MVAPAAPLPLTLSPGEARAVRKFQDWLERAMPGQVERLILYGSKARGDAHAESDVDMVLVLDNATLEQRNRVHAYTADLMLEDEVDLSAIIYGRDEFQRLAALGTPFMRNVSVDGVPLVGEGIMVGKGKPEEVVRAFLESAHHRLNAARLLVEGAEWRDSVSRAYYAVLDAADGALALLGVTPRSHAGTLSLFSLHLIKPGRVAGRYSAVLNQIQKSRLEADYDRMTEVTESQARSALATAEDFVAMIEALLPQLLAEGAAETDEVESNGTDDAAG